MHDLSYQLRTSGRCDPAGRSKTTKKICWTMFPSAHFEETIHNSYDIQKQCAKLRNSHGHEKDSSNDDQRYSKSNIITILATFLGVNYLISGFDSFPHILCITYDVYVLCPCFTSNVYIAYIYINNNIIYIYGIYAHILYLHTFIGMYVVLWLIYMGSFSQEFFSRRNSVCVYI